MPLGKGTLEKLEEKPEAVLLDILMPDLDGLEVLRRIREKDKKLPVFIITVSVDKEKFELARRRGHQDLW